MRKFEVVREDARTAFSIFTDEKKKKHQFPKDIKLPTRADKGSAGYDFYIPYDLELNPAKKTIIWTDVKADMNEDEMLLLFIRSSLAIKQGLMLSNNVAVIDKSYYGNESNDGNIGIPIVNTTGITVHLKEGERIAQGVFTKFLTTDDDDTTSEERNGGIGSSGK